MHLPLSLTNTHSHQHSRVRDQCACASACACVRVRIRTQLLLFSGLEAQMYIHLMLNPAVKLQQGLKDPPHWLAQKKPAGNTHTPHTSITYTHNGWSEILQETAQGNSCQVRTDYFPPNFLFLLFLPVFLTSTPLSVGTLSLDLLFFYLC